MTRLLILLSPLSLISAFCFNNLFAQQLVPVWQKTISGGSCFSSANHTADLNGDGVQDLVFGAGREGQNTEQAIVAINGKDGSFIWSRPARSQMYSSARFLDINADGTKDVLMAGRDAQMAVYNGLDGSTIWEFWPDSMGNASDSGWFNFFLPQWVSDQDGDGLEDFIISNGGLSSAGASDTSRPAGKLMLISSKDGTVIGMIDMPDGKETYFSPLLISGVKAEVLFGSGGETIGGSLWKILLKDLATGNSNNVQLLRHDAKKGFIAVPSLFRDGTLESLYAPQLSSGIYAWDQGASQPTWNYFKSGYEAYVSPALGYINDDAIPDVVTIFAHGVFPFYSSYSLVVLNGLNGSVLFQKDTLGLYQLASVNLVDIDRDGVDEILLGQNLDKGFTEVNYHTRLMVMDVNDDTIYSLTQDVPGLMLYAMPLLTDLDQNQQTDLIFVANRNTKNWYNHDSFTIARYEFNLNLSPISWPSYMGLNGDGYMDKHGSAAKPKEVLANQLLLFPNPATDQIEISNMSTTSHWQLYDVKGLSVAQGSAPRIELSGLANGVYWVRIASAEGITTKKIQVFR